MLNRDGGEVGLGWRVAAGITTTVASLGALGCAPGSESPDPAANDNPAAEAPGFGEQAAPPDDDTTSSSASTEMSVLDIPGYRMGEDGEDGTAVARVVVRQLDTYFETGEPSSLRGFNEAAQYEAQDLAASGATGVGLSPDAQYEWTRWPDQHNVAYLCLQIGSVAFEQSDGTTFNLGPKEGDVTFFQVIDGFDPEEVIGGLAGLAPSCRTGDEASPHELDSVDGTTTTTATPTTEAPTTTTANTGGDFNFSDDQGNYRFEKRNGQTWQVYEDGTEIFVGGT